MESIDKTTGEILNIPRGGLYTPLPVPAYKVLVAAKKHIAKDVLLCIVSHLDKGGTKAFPSYTTIARESGHSKGSIKKALDVLYELEFLKVHQQPIGIRKRNFYFSIYIRKLLSIFSKFSSWRYSYFIFLFNYKA